MKISKNFATLAISIFLLIITLPMPSYNADEIRYGKTILQQMNNSQNLLAVYDCLVDGCKDATRTISFQNLQDNITFTELDCVYRIFQDDYPEYFWVKNGYEYTLENNKIISVTPKYTFTGEQLDYEKTTFENKVNQLIEGLEGKSDYEKSLILHDRLADTAEYTTLCYNHQNAYGALVEGKAVCAGYSKAYQHLLNKVGITAWCIYGTSTNPSTRIVESHEWNLVCLDGKWYYSDVTWDDQGDYRFYTHLNMSASQLSENHKLSNFEEYKYLPNANSTDANYFVKNSLVYNDSNLNLNRLAKVLKDGNNKANLYINGDINTFQNNLYKNSPLLMKKMGIENGYNYSYTTATLEHEMIISLSITNPEHQHTLTMVPQKEPTCNKKGNLAYYTCACGHRFSDIFALTEITDISTLDIPALSHTPSDWKSDSNNHWKVCTNCGIEIANTLQPHTTPDKNNNCRTCSLSLFVETSKPNVSTAETTGNNTSSKNSSTESIISENSSLEKPLEDKNTSSIPSVEENTNSEKVEHDSNDIILEIVETESNDIKITYFVLPASIVGGGIVISLIILLIKRKI